MTLGGYVPRLVESLASQDSDLAFIAFASPERRCLGAVSRFQGYRPRRICLLRIDDEPNDERATNIQRFREAAAGVAEIDEIRVKHSDVVCGIDQLVLSVSAVAEEPGQVTVDISTFPKPSLLLSLRALSRLPTVARIRVLYSEPASYQPWIQEPLSYGVKRVAVVPTFTAPYRANQDLVLIMFLGYERDRALGMWQSIEPNRTIAVISRPSYHAEWEGRVEYLNAALLAGLDSDSIFHVDPRDPVATYNLLRRLVNPSDVDGANFYVAPLGTKPQTLGVHYFCEEFADAATVAYASPLEHASEYISEGVGRCWELPGPEGHK